MYFSRIRRRPLGVPERVHWRACDLVRKTCSMLRAIPRRPEIRIFWRPRASRSGERRLCVVCSIPARYLPAKPYRRTRLFADRQQHAFLDADQSFVSRPHSRRSSSGSAVAVAAGLVDIGLGTDTSGSIRFPPRQTACSVGALALACWTRPASVHLHRALTYPAYSAARDTVPRCPSYTTTVGPPGRG